MFLPEISFFNKVWKSQLISCFWPESRTLNQISPPFSFDKPKPYAPSSSSIAQSTRSKNRSHSCAFTLIELLVTVAIVAILASLLVPMAKSTIMRGQQAACASNLRQIGTAFHAYLADNNQTLPTFEGWWGYGGTTLSGQNAKPLDSYLESSKVFCCPADTRAKGVDGSGSIFASYGNSYSLNQAIALPGLELSGGKVIGVPLSRMVLLGDTTMYAKSYPQWKNTTWHGRAGTYAANLLFFDGHVELIEVQNSPLQSYGDPSIDAARTYFWTPQHN